MSKGYYSYVRVSTVRQGQSGTSLTEQREAIQRHAQRWSLRIVQEFEEKETAAKSGRPVFRQMLDSLKRGKAQGVIIHKIDRSARNLRDWAELGEIIDKGVDVHFANENLDLESRGGRLSADIQAVVAADYIRNLREEVKKGFYGRLKQGFYPMPAPIGYLDKGAAQAKEPDPIQAPLIRKLFELYASGLWSIRRLADEMYDLGLRTRGGKKVSQNSIAHILHNPFYTGLIKLGSTGELFVGRHHPIVSRALFDRAQDALAGKHIKGIRKHDFRFRRLVSCEFCEKKLIGEVQKGYVYYRCQTASCEQKTIREEALEEAMLEVFATLKFSEAENRYFQEEIERRNQGNEEWQQSLRQALIVQLEQAKSRLSNLTDAYLDGMFDKETYVEKKNQLLTNEQSITGRLAHIDSEPGSVLQQTQEILELANNAYLSYKLGDVEAKREMVQSVTSNFSVRDKTVLIKLEYPFQMIAERSKISNGGPQRIGTRTLSRLVSQLFRYFKSRKDKDENEEQSKVVEITSRRLKLAFRRANGIDQGRLAA